MEFSLGSLQLLTLPWDDTGHELTLEMPSWEEAVKLTRCDTTRRAIALMAQRFNYELARICYPGMGKGLEVLASMAGSGENLNEGNKTMTDQTERSLLTSAQPPEGFVWFGGVIVPALRPILDRMESSDEPTGLVRPTTDNASFKTIQWAINKASVELFGFDAVSMEDMKAAIQRDTSNDWYPEDLERKRQLYQQAETRFEQTARIRTKNGWMLLHFQCERTGVGDLVLSRGRQVSELVERPELLTLA